MSTYLTNTFNRNVCKQRGASAVEMALLLPLLILMLDGVLEFGLILHNQSVLTSAANLAARAGIVNRSAKLNDTQIAEIASNYCIDGLISLGTTTPATVTVVQSADSTYPNPLRVTVSYSFKGLFVGGLLSALQTYPKLSATTVMYNE
jgi:Flp pilus assembly protein TadG